MDKRQQEAYEAWTGLLEEMMAEDPQDAALTLLDLCQLAAKAGSAEPILNAMEAGLQMIEEGECEVNDCAQYECRCEQYEGSAFDCPIHVVVGKPCGVECCDAVFPTADEAEAHETDPESKHFHLDD